VRLITAMNLYLCRPSGDSAGEGTNRTALKPLRPALRAPRRAESAPHEVRPIAASRAFDAVIDVA
jgi:hypothetical protein